MKKRTDQLKAGDILFHSEPNGKIRRFKIKAISKNENPAKLNVTMAEMVGHSFHAACVITMLRDESYEVEGNELLEAHVAYINRLRNRGEPLVDYNCPACADVIATLAAPGQDWSTFATCPHCSGLHLKFTSGHDAYAVEVPK